MSSPQTILEQRETSDAVKILIRDATVVLPRGCERLNVLVDGSKIVALDAAAHSAADDVVSARGLHLLPGVIDDQVHFREPGLTHKEDLESGSRSAVMGGVTAVFEMPNTDPTTTTAAAMADKVARGHHRMHCDFAFFVGGTHEN